MIFAVMAMLAAVVGIGIAKADFKGAAQRKRDIECTRCAKRRRAEFSQCALNFHCVEIYHNRPCDVKSDCHENIPGLKPLPFALQIEPITAILSVSEQENNCETMLCGKFRIGCLMAQRGKE